MADLAILLAATLLSVCLAMRPEVIHRPDPYSLAQLPSLVSSLHEFQELAADAHDATSRKVVDATEQASNKFQEELNAMHGNETGLTDGAKEALREVIQVVKQTMLPAFDDAHAKEQELLKKQYAEVVECNSLMTTRLADEQNLAGLKSKASDLRFEQEKLASQIEDLRSRNSSSHERLVALMNGIQKPTHWNSFPTHPIPELWTEFLQQEEASGAAASLQRSELEAKLSEHEAASDLLDTTTEQHVIITATLDAVFCDWKGQLVTSCATHAECHGTSFPLLKSMQKHFVEARDKRVLAHKAGLQLVDHINQLVDPSASPTPDDSASRFALSHLDEPTKEVCPLSDLDAWHDAHITCDSALTQPIVLGSFTVVNTCTANGQNAGKYYWTEARASDDLRFMGRDDVPVTVSQYRNGEHYWTGDIVMHDLTGSWIKPSVSGECGQTGTGYGRHFAQPITSEDFKVGDVIDVIQYHCEELASVKLCETPTAEGQSRWDTARR